MKAISDPGRREAQNAVGLPGGRRGPGKRPASEAPRDGAVRFPGPGAATLTSATEFFALCGFRGCACEPTATNSQPQGMQTGGNEWKVRNQKRLRLKKAMPVFKILTIYVQVNALQALNSRITPVLVHSRSESGRSTFKSEAPSDTLRRGALAEASPLWLCRPPVSLLSYIQHCFPVLTKEQALRPVTKAKA